MRLQSCLLLSSVALPLVGLGAFPAAASEDTAYWQNLNLSVKLSDEIRVSSETSLRSSDARGFYQLQETIMLGYKVSKKVTVSAGYVHSVAYSHGDYVSTERRFRQQVNVDNIGKVGPFMMSGRVRLEQRWRDDLGGTGWRLRPYIKASAPVIGKVKFNLSSELFFDLNTTTFQSVGGFERARNSATFSVPVGKKFSLELGYMNQHARVPTGPDRVDHVLVTTIGASF